MHRNHPRQPGQKRNAAPFLPPVTRFPPSDHCDGTRFFNPAHPRGHSFWSALKMLLTLRYQPWPKHVENTPAPDLHRPLGDDEVAVTFVNHSTVLIQTRQFNFLTDPVWSDRVSPFAWVGPRRHRSPGLPFDQLPRIDFVLLSHNHYDHLDLATVRRLQETFHPRFLVPLGNRTFLAARGIPDVVELDWWQSWEGSADLKITFAPAQHFAGRGLFDRNHSLWGSYVLAVGGRTLYFGADTGYAAHFRAVRERFGRPDLALLPIGAYEPRWFMQPVHLNPADAVQAHRDLGSAQSIGIHFGTFQLTGEAIDQPVKDLATALAAEKVPPAEFITLGEGRTRVFQLHSVRLG